VTLEFIPFEELMKELERRFHAFQCSGMFERDGKWFYQFWEFGPNASTIGLCDLMKHEITKANSSQPLTDRDV